MLDTINKDRIGAVTETTGCHREFENSERIGHGHRAKVMQASTRQCTAKRET